MLAMILLMSILSFIWAFFNFTLYSVLCLETNASESSDGLAYSGSLIHLITVTAYISYVMQIISLLSHSGHIHVCIKGSTA